MARLNLWRWGVLGLAGLYFLVPLAASVVFTVDVPGQGLTFDAYGQIFSTEGFVSSLLLSLELALATIVVVLLLMVPAMVALRLGAPRLRQDHRPAHARRVRTPRLRPGAGGRRGRHRHPRAPP